MSVLFMRMGLVYFDNLKRYNFLMSYLFFIIYVFFITYILISSFMIIYIDSFRKIIISQGRLDDHTIERPNEIKGWTGFL